MKNITLISIILGIALMNTVFAETNYNKPQFTLEFNIYGSGAEIFLNDIPIYIHDTEGQTISQKPIPESIIDGENILTVKSYPLKNSSNGYEEGAYIEAIISVREKGEAIGNTKPIIQLKINPTQTEDKLLSGTISGPDNKSATIISHNKNMTVASRSSEIKSPFPRWAWQDGLSIDNTSENFEHLLEKYKEIWTALNNNDMGKTKSLYDPAAKEFSQAYYYNDNQHGHRIMNTGGLMGDDEWVLADIKQLIGKMKYKLNIYANGKIANIIDQDQRTPIVYLNTKVKALNIQKFGFYKNKSGEWIMIR